MPFQGTRELHLPTDGSLIEARLRLTVKKIQQAISVGDLDFSDMLGMGIAEFQRVKHGLAGFSVQNLESLCSTIDLNIDVLFNGKIDYRAIARQWNGRTAPVLPDHYQIPEQQLSRVRAIQTVLTYLKMFHGADYAGRFLTRLQVHPETFSYANDFVSTKLVSDVYANLRKIGLQDDQLRMVGRTTALMRRLTFPSLMLSCKTPKELYLALFELRDVLFDRVMNYRILELTDTMLTIEVTAREETKDAFHSHWVGSREMCLFLQGVFSSFPGALPNTPFAEISESECMYCGGARCVYHLQWKNPVQANSY